MATLIVYPDAADLTEREINTINEPTLTAYLNAHVPNWDKGETGHKLKAPRFAATLNGSTFAPCRWSTQVLLAHDVIEIVIPPKATGAAIVAWVAVGLAVASVAYTVYMMNQMDMGASSTVPDGSNIYDINVQANSADLMGVRPQWFGRHQTVPNYLCEPFKYYDENGDANLCLMLHCGEGYYQISTTDITIASTPVSSLGDDVKLSIFEPGADVSGHEAHKNIYTADEVGGTDSSTGLDFIGPVTLVSIDSDDDYTIVLSGNTIRFKKGSKTKNINWDNDTTFILTGTSTISVLFNDIVELVDSGSDEETGESLPDKLIGARLSSSLSVGQKIQLSGAGANDSTYIVATVSDTELTLKDINGDDVTWLTPAASVTVKITRTDTDDGLYKVISTDSSYRLVVERVGDANWSNFSSGSYSNGVELDVTSDNLPDYQLGPYVACPEGHTTNYLEIDMLRSNGWGHYNDKGKIESITVNWEIWVRDTDLGASDQWQKYPYSYTGTSYDQMGETHIVNLPQSIRPEVMLVRKTKSYDDTKYLDELKWQRLKCKLPTATRYANSTTLALSIRADSSLSSSATNKIKVLQTRKLSVPDGIGGWTNERYATRDIAPAIRYLVQNSGGSDDDLDMDELLALHNYTWSPNQEYFDGGFVDETTVYDVIKTILQAGMAEFCFDIGKILPKRLEKKVGQGHVYTPDIMTGDGLTVTTTLYDPDENEGLIVYYMDPTDWTTASVKCWLGDRSTISKWSELELTTGVISKTRAWRIGMRAVRRTKAEKISYSFSTEMDALNSSYLDYAELADDLPNFGQFGEIQDWQVFTDDNDQRFTLITVDRDLTWTDNQTYYMTVRRNDGTGNGPFVATKIDERVIKLAGTLDFIPDLSGAIEPPLWLFGNADRYSEPAIISSIKPSIDDDTTTCAVTATNYSDSIFADDNNEVPGENIMWWE